MSNFIFLTIMSALIGILAPGSGERGMKKAISCLAALTLILAAAVPIANAFESIQALPEQFIGLIIPDAAAFSDLETNAREWVIQFSLENIEEDTAELIENRFALENGSVKVKAFIEQEGDGTLMLAFLRVTAVSIGALPENRVAEYVSDVLGCPCEVVVDGEIPQIVTEEIWKQ